MALILHVTFLNPGVSAQGTKAPPVYHEGYYYGEPVIDEIVFHSPLEGPGGWIWIYKDPEPCPTCPEGLTDDTPLSGESSTVVGGDGLGEKPVAYVSNSTGRVSASFGRDCDEPILIGGLGTDGYHLPYREVALAGDLMFYPVTAFTQKFPENVVQYWSDFEISWYRKTLNAGGPDIPDPDADLHFATTSHTIYVTHKEPLPYLEIGPDDPFWANAVYHTGIHLACSNAAGMSDITSIIDGIYSEFLKGPGELFPCVKKVGSENCMQYWGQTAIDDFFELCRGVRGLLAYEDNACGEWAFLLLMLHRIQGIGEEFTHLSEVQWKLDYLLPTEPINYKSELMSDITEYFGDEADMVQNWGGPETPHAMFFVNDWPITAESLRDFLVEYHEPGVVVHTLDNENELVGGDIIGVPGQGNLNPRSVFENHAIIRYVPDPGSPDVFRYYDPSYGTPYVTSKAVYEALNFAGFGARVWFRDTPFSMPHFIVWPRELNTPIVQLIITP